MRRNFFSEDFVRIISGKVRGLSLISPAGEDTRPTLDRVKEAIFNIIMPYILDSEVLDLFAGSGGLGIEAISRGAKNAVFVDKNSESINCINKNINAARFCEFCQVKKADSIQYLNQCNTSFDIIFLDPPYKENLYEQVLKLILNKNILKNDGIIALEYDYCLKKPDIPDGLEIVKERKYGRVGVLVLSQIRS